MFRYFPNTGVPLQGVRESSCAVGGFSSLLCSKDVSWLEEEADGEKTERATGRVEVV